MAQVIAKLDRSHYKTICTTENHQIIADEPLDQGGEDLGPNPYDFLLAALGSCVAITIRMYADRKGWPLEEVEVHLDQQRIEAKDCEGCQSQEGYVHRIEKRLKFIGDLSPDQRKRLTEIAERCPVQRTLEREIVFDSSVMA